MWRGFEPGCLEIPKSAIMVIALQELNVIFDATNEVVEISSIIRRDIFKDADVSVHDTPEIHSNKYTIFVQLIWVCDC